MVIWLVGMSGAGKSTVAEMLFKKLIHHAGIGAVPLDGDLVRLMGSSFILNRVCRVCVNKCVDTLIKSSSSRVRHSSMKVSLVCDERLVMMPSFISVLSSFLSLF